MYFQLFVYTLYGHFGAWQQGLMGNPELSAVLSPLEEWDLTVVADSTHCRVGSGKTAEPTRRNPLL